MAHRWSKIRKILEQDLLCPALRGRVQYFCTHYHKAPDQYGRVCLRVDGKEYAKANPYSYYVNGYHIMERRLKEAQSIPCREWEGGRFLHEEENAQVEEQVRRTAIWDGSFDICDFTRRWRGIAAPPSARACLPRNHWCGCWRFWTGEWEREPLEG